MILCHGIQEGANVLGENELFRRIISSNKLLKSKGRPNKYADQEHLPVVYFSVKKSLEDVLNAYRTGPYKHVFCWKLENVPQDTEIKLLDYNYNAPIPPAVPLKTILERPDINIIGMTHEFTFTKVDFILSKTTEMSTEMIPLNYKSLQGTTWITFTPDPIPSNEYLLQLYKIEAMFLKEPEILSLSNITEYMDGVDPVMVKMNTMLERLDRLEPDRSDKTETVKKEILDEIDLHLSDIIKLYQNSRRRDLLMFLSKSDRDPVVILDAMQMALTHLKKELQKRFNATCNVCSSMARYKEECSLLQFCSAKCHKQFYQ